MTTTHRIVWLHLSDLHLCEQKTGWDGPRVLKPLLKDLQKMERDHGLQPDLIFFTGDAAFGNLPESSLAEQYRQVAQFLDSVRKAFTVEVPKENVFLVPGNHDVDRDEAIQPLTDWLRDKTRKADEITTLIQQGKNNWKAYLKRLHAYRGFLETHGYGHLLQDPERLHYAAIREIKGIKLGIGGLNSAWSCGEDHEQGSLWMGGNWQSGMLTGKFEQERADIRIALMHHPLNWFAEQEGPILSTRFTKTQDFHVLLHGHEHEDWVYPSDDGPLRIAAAACYERSERKNGYNFVRLDVDSGLGEVWLRRYEETGWIPRIVANNKTDNNGCWRLPLNWLKELQAKFAKNQPDNSISDDVILVVRDKIGKLLNKPTMQEVGDALLAEHSSPENREEEGAKDNPDSSISEAVILTVRAEIGRLLSRSNLQEVGKALLLAGQSFPLTTKPEELLVPLGIQPFPLVEKIDSLHDAVRDTFKAFEEERKPIPVAEAKEILEWLLLLAVPDGWVKGASRRFQPRSTISDNKIAEQYSIWAEVGDARLELKRPRLELEPGQNPRKVKTPNQLGHDELERGLQNADALTEVLREIYIKVMKREPPVDEDWKAQLPHILRRRRKDDDRYHIAIPHNRHATIAANPVWVKELGEILSLLGVFVYGTGNNNRVLIVPEDKLLVAIREFLILLRKYQ